MKYAWYVEFEAQIGTVRAWVYAESAEEARRLCESQHQVACFNSIVRHEASKILCYME